MQASKEEAGEREGHSRKCYYRAGLSDTHGELEDPDIVAVRRQCLAIRTQVGAMIAVNSRIPRAIQVAVRST